MSDEGIAYFQGFRDGLYDAANFLDNLSRTSSVGVRHFTKNFELIAQTMRHKGDVAAGVAESVGKPKQ